MTIEALSFPVIAFAEDGCVLGYPTKLSLANCPRQALTNGYFAGLVIIDSQGQIVTVEKVKRIQNPRNFVQNVKGIFANSVQVDFILEAKISAQISLSDLKAKAIASLENSCDDYAADEIRQMVTEASSYESIIRIFYNKSWSDE